MPTLPASRPRGPTATALAAALAAALGPAAPPAPAAACPRTSGDPHLPHSRLLRTLARTTERLATTPGVPLVPPGGASSDLDATADPGRRLARLVLTVCMLETGARHHDPAGRPLRTGSRGDLGLMQLSPGAALEAARFARARGASAPPAPVAARGRWAQNLELGALYLLGLVERFRAPPGADARARELGLLAALAAYPAGPGAPFLGRGEAALRDGIAARPVLRRYVREGAGALGLGSWFDAAWRAALAPPGEAAAGDFEGNLLRARTRRWCLEEAAAGR